MKSSIPFLVLIILLSLGLNACKKEKCKCVFDDWAGQYKMVSSESIETFVDANPPRHA